MATRTEVTLSDGFTSIGLRLALDPQGRPLFSTETLSLERLIRPYAQLAEASYANFLPGIGGVYAQTSLSGGAGKKIAVNKSDPDADKYYYTRRIDASAGAAVKGPHVDALALPANATAPTGGFVLGGTFYLCCGRIICSYSVGGNSLAQAADLGASVSASGPATFFKLAAETSGESNLGDTATDTITTADARIAQQFVSSQSGVVYLGRVDVKLIAATTNAAGDVRLQVFTDLNGKPGVSIASARMLYTTVPTSAAVMSFRFDDGDEVALPPGEPFWLVLDQASATATNYIGWRRDGTGGYAAGISATSADAGNKWTPSSVQDYYFTTYVKVATATAFVGDSSGTVKLQTTTNGTAYTGDTYAHAGAFCVVADQLVRDVQGTGAVRTSSDGVNWDEAIVLGNPTVAVLELLRSASDLCIAVKGDSIWALDLSASPPTVQQLLSATTTARGSAAFGGTVFVPTITHGIVGISGDFSAGFTVTENLGIESAPEWDNPLNHTVAAALSADRFHLYAFYATTTTGTYEVWKSAEPLKKVWHGSVATITTGGPTGATAPSFDPGSTNPHIFFAGASGFVSHMTQPITANPANDPSYAYDASTAGTLDFPYMHGNFQINPKAHFNEGITFLRRSSGDYVEMLYDLQDGDGFRRMPDPGRLYDTDILEYPNGVQSRLNARRLVLTNSLSTGSPVILAVGESFAVRPGADTREIIFTVRAETGLSAQMLGDILGATGATMTDVLFGATVDGGTFSLTGPGGERFERVLVRIVKSVLLTETEQDAVAALEVTAVGDFVGRAA